MKTLLALAKDSNEIMDIVDSYNQRVKEQYIYGLSGSQKAFLFASLKDRIKKPMVILTTDNSQAERIRMDLKSFLPEERCEIFPSFEILSFDIFSQSREDISKRLSILNQLVRGENIIIIAPVKSVMKRLTPPEIYVTSIFTIHKGKEYRLGEIVNKLIANGYERVSMVERAGQFSVRGGILDLYTDEMDHPARVEFFGDEVDGIRSFEPLSQRSVGDLHQVEVTPASELLVDLESEPEAVERIERSLAVQLKKIKDINIKNSLKDKMHGVIEKIQNNTIDDLNPTILPFYYPDAPTFFSYLPADSIIMLDEPARLQEIVQSRTELLRNSFQISLEKGTALPEQLEVFDSWEGIVHEVKQFPVFLWASLLRKINYFEPDRLHSLLARPLYPYMGNIDTFLHEVRSYQKNNYRLIVASSSEERAEKIHQILQNHGVQSVFVKELAAVPERSQCIITVGNIESGFEFPSMHLAVIVDHEISGKKRAKKRNLSKEFSAFNWQDLKQGDYVVHVNHGIGQYIGLTTLEIENTKKDYLQIQYQDEDRVYVPVEQMGMVQRYIGPDGYKPKMSRLGGAEWQKAKLSAKAAVAEMADELLQIYAAREKAKGYMFSPDTPWQLDFESRFEYQETDDQLKAVEEVKEDMEKLKPMDRLLCGDVGYGKTEVAIRAAFKATMDGKQTGVLVPTTVLAQQHFNTFHSRFQGFPVKIEMLSRFVSEAKQKEVIKGLAQGTVDIVIGTHRLLQKDIAFKNLGLLIVDEEQRFGVRHKEKIKAMKANVDVLTLTATPIPRTLHMALSGIRDMSMIMEPPEDRLPVRTFVLEENEMMVRDVIMQELERGGQIYYIHNKVKTIDRAARKLQKLIPEASIVVGHGQMKEEELERTMIDFIEKEADILVCTTIIETGMDIPNVNTILVENADHFGLSQLYQLRGRVGRSHRQGYCYLMFKKDKVLTEIAEKRLAAIKEFTEFGSGFKIAMKDLEIRGAGNLLGAEQHGHLSAVGFELYCRLLEETVSKAKGETENEQTDPLIDIKVDAYLSDHYIPDGQQKIEMYKKIAALQTEEEIRDIIDEMVDRFGDPPRETQQLLDIIRLKIDAKEVYIDSINQIKGNMKIRFSTVAPFDQEAVAAGIRQYDRRIEIVVSPKPHLSIDVGGMSQKEVITMMKMILRALKTARK